MPVTTTQLVMLLFVFIVNRSTLQLVQVVFEGNWAVVAYHWVPLWDDACLPCALVMGNGTIVVSVVNMEAPSTVLPQGTIPFSMVRFFVTALETIGEGGAFALVTLVFEDSVQLEAIFSFDVTPLIFRWPLSSKDTG